MGHIIEVKDLKKSYNNVKAVDGLSFNVEQGEMFAFLGPNGAGKSTTINMISTIITIDEGTVNIGGYEVGKDDEAIHNLIGVVFQDGVLDPVLTVEENLKIRGSFYKLKGQKLQQAIQSVCQTTGITDLLSRKYGTLSGGQKRRCDIARALINTPKVLFLDEPTTGLDPQTRKYVWDTIFQLKRETDLTIFLTTHYMEEVVNADNVVVIDGGKIVAQGTPSELKEKYTSDKLILSSNNTERLKSKLKQLNINYIEKENRIVVKLESTLSAIDILNSIKDEIQSCEVTMGSMDDVFINIAGKEIRA